MWPAHRHQLAATGLSQLGMHALSSTRCVPTRSSEARSCHSSLALGHHPAILHVICTWSAFEVRSSVAVQSAGSSHRREHTQLENAQRRMQAPWRPPYCPLPATSSPCNRHGVLEHRLEGTLLLHVLHKRAQRFVVEQDSTVRNSLCSDAGLGRLIQAPPSPTHSCPLPSASATSQRHRHAPECPLPRPASQRDARTLRSCCQIGPVAENSRDLRLSPRPQEFRSDERVPERSVAQLSCFDEDRILDPKEQRVIRKRRLAVSGFFTLSDTAIEDARSRRCAQPSRTCNRGQVRNLGAEANAAHAFKEGRGVAHPIFGAQALHRLAVRLEHVRVRGAELRPVQDETDAVHLVLDQARKAKDSPVLTISPLRRGAWPLPGSTAESMTGSEQPR